MSKEDSSKDRTKSLESVAEEEPQDVAQEDKDDQNKPTVSTEPDDIKKTPVDDSLLSSNVSIVRSARPSKDTNQPIGKKSNTQVNAPERAWVSSILDVHILNSIDSGSQVTPFQPGQDPQSVSRRQSVAPADTARRQSVAPADTARRQSVAPPDATRRQSIAPPDATRRQSVAPHDATRRQSVAPSDATRRQSVAPHDATRRQSVATAADLARRQSVVSRKGVVLAVSDSAAQTPSENPPGKQAMASRRASTVSVGTNVSFDRPAPPSGQSPGRVTSNESIASKVLEERSSVKSTSSSRRPSATPSIVSSGRGAPPGRGGPARRGAAPPRRPVPYRRGAAPALRRGGAPARGWGTRKRGTPARGAAAGKGAPERSMFHSNMFPFAKILAPESRRQSTVSTTASEYGDQRRRSSVVVSHTLAVKSLGSGRVRFVIMATCMFTTVIAFTMHFQSIIDHMSQRGKTDFVQLYQTIPQARGLWTHEKCPYKLRERPWQGSFDWSPTTKLNLLRYYFLGFISSGIPAAILADQLSAKWVVFFSLMINVYCSMFTPWMASFAPPEWLALLFVCQGVGGGAFMPGMVTVISFWAPPRRRSTYTGIIFGGIALGKALALLASWATATTSYHYMFHFGVLICLPPALMWAMWMETKPSESRYIHTEERLNIIAAHEGTRVDQRYFPFPYGRIVASVPFWALFFFHFCTNCLNVMLYYQVTNYIAHVLYVDVEEKIVVLFIPYLAMFAVSALAGFIIDLTNKGNPDRLEMNRKIAGIVGIICPVAFLVAIPSGGCSLVTSCTLYAFAIALSGTQSVSLFTNHLDISPNFAGILFGITNTFATIPYLLIPSIMSALFNDIEREKHPAIYAISFYLAGLIALIGIIMFIVLGSTNIEPWNEPWGEEEEEEEGQ